MQAEAQKPKTLSFEQIQEDGRLRWAVQSSNWKHMGELQDVEEEMQEAMGELRGLFLRIGKTVVAGKTPEQEHIERAQELQQKIENKKGQVTQIRDQMHAAMRYRLQEMLPPDALNNIPPETLTEFCDGLEKTSDTQLRVSRMLLRGEEELKKREQQTQ